MNLIRWWRLPLILIKLMTSIEQLNANLVALVAAVNALIIAYQTPDATEAQIIAAATQVSSLTEAINKALTPVPPAP